jgi:tRNA A-37 threonylcarbamoyl transferase component Bud32
MDPQSKTLVLHSLIGQTLKQYRIDGVIGQGGMGVVFRAHDLKLQRTVALKLLPSELTDDPERRKRFLVEARTAARLSHPAIAQVYDVDEHKGTIFIAMELVEGKTVRELIQRRELDLLGTIDIGLQVSAGLAKAHDSGIVHRDVKPANVIQTPDGHVKILDFGLAKLLDADTPIAPAGGNQDLSALTRTQTGMVKGTPAYMSPEQVKGEPLDFRSDLFSLGVMLFEMATGEVPFRRATSLEMMHAIAFDNTPAIRTLQPNVPGGFQRIVARCLRKRPGDRYPHARALMEDLRVLRREMESGSARSLSLKERIGDTFGHLARLKPSQYAWFGAGILGLAAVIYLLTAHAGMGSFIVSGVIGLVVYRNIRHQPRRVLDRFVRRVAKIPEVRFIACRDRVITVGVDRALGQLYGRINNQLNLCNRKLFFGQPLGVVIRDDLTAEETRQLLSGPGVQYVRESPTPENGPPA